MPAVINLVTFHFLCSYIQTRTTATLWKSRLLTTKALYYWIWSTRVFLISFLEIWIDIISKRTRFSIMTRFLSTWTMAERSESHSMTNYPFSRRWRSAVWLSKAHYSHCSGRKNIITACVWYKKKKNEKSVHAVYWQMASNMPNGHCVGVSLSDDSRVSFIRCENSLLENPRMWPLILTYGTGRPKEFSLGSARSLRVYVPKIDRMRWTCGSLKDHWLDVVGLYVYRWPNPIWNWTNKLFIILGIQAECLAANCRMFSNLWYHRHKWEMVSRIFLSTIEFSSSSSSYLVLSRANKNYEKLD